MTVRPRTASGRDAMLRAGAEAAVEVAMQQPGAQLGGMPPSAFITGLARDLGELNTNCVQHALCQRIWVVLHSISDGCSRIGSHSSSWWCL